MKVRWIILFCLTPLLGFTQYTSYFTGNPTDMIVSPTPPGGLCLMGGATENDEAMKWFLERAYGGDVLVIRTSGSDGYNDYLYSGLGVNVNSVETIVFNNSSASYSPYVLDRISKAEAIWIAGGDQWDYISFWRNTPVDSLINVGISSRGMTIGGTSAGMAIQGGFYFSAENGTVTSGDALLNPYNSNITVDSATFIQNEFMHDVITDTHYDNPDRKGRHVVFLAHILENYGIRAKGIACEEYTAVCIDENGLAKVFGEYPAYDDYAFFVQVNCEYEGISADPEVYTAGTPLTWNYGGDILKVYQVPGTLAGTNTFDLSDWQTGTGGNWVDWSVNSGNLIESLPAAAPNCSSGQNEWKMDDFTLYPNPAGEEVLVEFSSTDERFIELFDVNGRRLSQIETNALQHSFHLADLPPGVYQLKVSSNRGVLYQRFVRN